jgi:hypothetical protein
VLHTLSWSFDEKEVPAPLAVIRTCRTRLRFNSLSFDDQHYYRGNDIKPAATDIGQDAMIKERSLIFTSTREDVTRASSSAFSQANDMRKTRRCSEVILNPIFPVAFEVSASELIGLYVFLEMSSRRVSGCWYLRT